ncbi:MAG: hypothetical protein EXX96DRAFT_558700, partial [Benjaminiella poitrasii]
MDILVSNAAISTAQIYAGLATCQNITVGEYKYQMYCMTDNSLVGSCQTLPAQYTAGSVINCFTVTSQSFFQSLYRSTGYGCGVNCYYPINILMPQTTTTTIRIPTSVYVPALTSTTAATTTTRGAASTSFPNDNNSPDLPDFPDLPDNNGFVMPGDASSSASRNSVSINKTGPHFMLDTPTLLLVMFIVFSMFVGAF